MSAAREKVARSLISAIRFDRDRVTMNAIERSEFISVVGGL
jgi:hypothetical protein